MSFKDDVDAVIKHIDEVAVNVPEQLKELWMKVRGQAATVSNVLQDAAQQDVSEAKADVTSDVAAAEAVPAPTGSAMPTQAATAPATSNPTPETAAAPTAQAGPDAITPV